MNSSEQRASLFLSTASELAVFEIVIGYRVRHCKGITIYNAAEVNLLQYLFALMKKIYFTVKKGWNSK